jgi:hypothetical protein
MTASAKEVNKSNWSRAFMPVNLPQKVKRISLRLDRLIRNI